VGGQHAGRCRAARRARRGQDLPLGVTVTPEPIILGAVLLTAARPLDR
jgi:hypothetical protein